jgi:hypothetical protein
LRHGAQAALDAARMEVRCRNHRLCGDGCALVDLAPLREDVGEGCTCER